MLSVWERKSLKPFQIQLIAIHWYRKLEHVQLNYKKKKMKRKSKNSFYILSESLPIVNTCYKRKGLQQQTINVTKRNICIDRIANFMLIKKKINEIVSLFKWQLNKRKTKPPLIFFWCWFLYCCRLPCHHTEYRR